MEREDSEIHVGLARKRELYYCLENSGMHSVAFSGAKAAWQSMVVDKDVVNLACWSASDKMQIHSQITMNCCEPP